MVSENKKSKHKAPTGIGLSVRLKILAVIACWMTIIFVPASFSQTDQPLEITNAYMPKIPPVSRTAAIYLTFRNDGDSSKIISSVSTPIAQQAMFHETTEQNGMSKMKHLGKIVVAPGDQVKLTPGGMHLMLMGLSLKPTTKKIQLTLHFESGEQQTLLVPITSSNDRKNAIESKSVSRKLISKKTPAREK